MGKEAAALARGAVDAGQAGGARGRGSRGVCVCVCVCVLEAMEMVF